jgi:glycosyltransferase involved in cell wall biosynthesis
MRILVHDYAGHAAPAQLARTLAGRGHDVHYVYRSSTLERKGPLEREHKDPGGYDAIGIDQKDDEHAGLETVKALVNRRKLEAEFGGRIAQHLRLFEPDVVLSAHAPLDTDQHVLRVAKETGVRFVKWMYEVRSETAKGVFGKKLFGMGRAAVRYYASLEQKQATGADALVLASEDFEEPLKAMGASADEMRVVHDWAPIELYPKRPQVNAWSHQHGLSGLRVFMYAGSLSLPSDPDLLARLAASFTEEHRKDVRVVVISEGPGAEALKQLKVERGLDKLVILPFQKQDDMPNALAAATVQLATLPHAAGPYVIPAKVSTAFTAGRPILLSAPIDNYVSRLVEREKAGVVADSLGPQGFVDAAADLLSLDHELQMMGQRARAYAEQAFVTEEIAHRFEEVLIG